MKPAIGQGLDRVDGRKKVTGQATYAAEVEVANVAHAVIVGATIARGRVTAIDTEAASKAPGVLAVLTHANAPAAPGAGAKEKPNDRILQALQDDEVRYHDQPIAVVVAETLERAQHAALMITATYDEAAAVADLEGDLDAAFAPRADNPSQAPDSSRGDVEAGLEAAAARVEARYTTALEQHSPMEPHATIAVWQGDDHLTLYDSTQAIFNVRARVAASLGLAPEQVRVIGHFCGGGFGGKGAAWSHVVLAALAAKATRRPVKLAITRPQMFSLVGHRPKTVQTVAVGADKAGRLTAIRHDTISETSRFDQFVERCGAVTRMLYACPNVTTTHRLVAIDVPTPTYQRAPGESTGTFALESALDELAGQLGVDPVDLRIRNHADADPNDGKPWSSKSLLECYRRGAAQFGWARRKAAPRATRDGGWLIGTGMATATRPSRQQPASAVAKISADGDILVQAGTQDIGTGTYTVMTQIAADALGVPVGEVRFELGDTTFPETPPSVGSFTVASTGPAVHRAATALRRALLERAIADPGSPLHGLAVDGIAVEDGVAFAKAAPTRRDPYADIVARSREPEILAADKAAASPEREQYSIHGFGAIFVEVGVDEDLGEIRVRRMTGAFAGGRILNVKTARSQLIGGMVWGIGMALHEHAVRDLRTARAVARDLVDYHVPVNADVPELEVILVEEEDRWVNELGAKGIGELSTPGVAAAIANAIHHATGIRVRDIPITLDKLLAGGTS